MCMPNLGTMALKQILEMGKRIKDHGGLGFKGGSSKTNSPNSTEATQKVKITIVGIRSPCQHLDASSAEKWHILGRNASTS